MKSFPLWSCCCWVMQLFVSRSLLYFRSVFLSSMDVCAPTTSDFPISVCIVILLLHNREVVCSSSLAFRHLWRASENCITLRPWWYIARLFFSYPCQRFLQYRNGQQSNWITKWSYCIAILSQIVSPLLPVALEIGQIYASGRLKVRTMFLFPPCIQLSSHKNVCWIFLPFSDH